MQRWGRPFYITPRWRSKHGWRFGIRLYQEPPYDIVGRLDFGLEIRLIRPTLAAEVELPVAGGSGDVMRHFDCCLLISLVLTGLQLRRRPGSP